MRIELEMKYRTDSAPNLHLSAYEVSNSKELRKVLGVLKKLGEAMDVCIPPAKDRPNVDTKTNKPTTKSAVLAQTANGK